MTKTPTTKTSQDKKGDGIIADTVWCARQVTRALSSVFSAAHAVGSFLERSMGMASHFTSAADHGMNKLHKMVSKPQTLTPKM